MNKNPTANRMQLDFKVGNTHVLAAWVIAQHGLQVLSRWMTLSIVIGLALQTGNYRLDESMLVGKSGGEPMSFARSDAFFTLSMYAYVAFSNHTTLRDLVPCIDTILHGGPRAHCRTNGVDMGLGNVMVPSTYEMVERHSLATLKALAADVRGKVGQNTEPKASRGGNFIVLDWLSMPQTQQTMMMMQSAGLSGRSCLSYDQLVDACGYLATGWAAMLHSLGAAFHTLECTTAAQLNSHVFIATANTHLRLGKSTTAVKLTGDQIIELATAINPDGAGQSPAWLHSPMPINLFNVFFARTCAEERYHGVVHIVVVNTDAQFSFDVSVETGIHWFLAAWYINPVDEEVA